MSEAHLEDIRDALKAITKAGYNVSSLGINPHNPHNKNNPWRNKVCEGCGRKGAIGWNPFNKVIECHSCGHIYSEREKVNFT